MGNALRASAIALGLLLVCACAPELRIGSRCSYNSDCPSPYTCGFGRCRAECRENRDCPLGALCLLDDERRGTCSLKDDPGCSEPGAQCPEGLTCASGECVNACESLAECPPDALCIAAVDGRARCARVDSPADAGARDAALSNDAGVPGDGGDAGVGDRWVEVIASDGSACARNASGAVWCWGSLALGDSLTTHRACGARDCSPTPVRVQFVDELGQRAELPAAASLTTGIAAAMCAVLVDGRVACWGPRWGPSIPTGSSDGSIARLARREAGGFVDGVRAVGIGSEHGIAWRGASDPILYGWGDDDLGQLGLDRETRELAVPVAPVPSADALAVGGWHACALRGGEVWCWGENDLGQSGGADTGAGVFLASAARVGTLAGATAITASRSHTCALAGEDVYCWGYYAALGIFSPPETCGSDPSHWCSTEPVRVYRNSGVQYRALGRSHLTDDACAIDATERAWCWGLNSDGQLLTDGSVREPIAMSALPQGVTAITIGVDHGCAIASGEVWCWGANDAGQLGRGTVATDTAVLPPARVVLP